MKAKIIEICPWEDCTMVCLEWIPNDPFSECETTYLHARDVIRLDLRVDDVVETRIDETGGIDITRVFLEERT